MAFCWANFLGQMIDVGKIVKHCGLTSGRTASGGKLSICSHSSRTKLAYKVSLSHINISPILSKFSIISKRTVLKNDGMYYLILLLLSTPYKAHCLCKDFTGRKAQRMVLTIKNLQYMSNVFSHNL